MGIYEPHTDSFRLWCERSGESHSEKNQSVRRLLILGEIMVRKSSSDTSRPVANSKDGRKSKRNKKDLNKRGESKEGTDMDAFYDAKKEVSDVVLFI